MRTSALWMAVLSLAGLATGAVADRLFGRAPKGHIPTREIAILSQAAQQKFPTIVLGDSIVELAQLPDLCGTPTLNAGIAGGRVSDVLAFAPRLLAMQRPALIVIAVGVNDAWATGATPEDAFRDQYRRLIRLAQASHARVVLLKVAPVGHDRFDKARTFDSVAIERVNRQIATLGFPVIDLAAAMKGPDGALPDVYTDDGVHPNAAGYRPWRHALSQACRLGQPALS